MTFREKHEAYIRQLQLGVHPRRYKGNKDTLLDLQAELERKFDELFGSTDDLDDEEEDEED